MSSHTRWSHLQATQRHERIVHEEDQCTGVAQAPEGRALPSKVALLALCFRPRGDDTEAVHGHDDPQHHCQNSLRRHQHTRPQRREVQLVVQIDRAGDAGRPSWKVRVLQEDVQKSVKLPHVYCIELITMTDYSIILLWNFTCPFRINKFFLTTISAINHTVPRTFFS